MYISLSGMTKGPSRDKEIWWWNRDVEEIFATRKVCYNAWLESKSDKDKHALHVT